MKGFTLTRPGVTNCGRCEQYYDAENIMSKLSKIYIYFERSYYLYDMISCYILYKYECCNVEK